MNNLKIFTIILLIGFVVSIIRHNNTIEELNNTIVILETENGDLVKKLNLMEDNFENFIKKRENNNIRIVYKTTEKKIKVPVEKQLEKVNKDIDEFEKNMDSIKSLLPNRKGQELINSLKLKTSI